MCSHSQLVAPFSTNRVCVCISTLQRRRLHFKLSDLCKRTCVPQVQRWKSKEERACRRSRWTRKEERSKDHLCKGTLSTRNVSTFFHATLYEGLAARGVVHCKKMCGCFLLFSEIPIEFWLPNKDVVKFQHKSERTLQTLKILRFFFKHGEKIQKN